MNGILEDRFAGPGSPTNMELGYFFLRIMLGMNLFTHGFMRFLTGISAWEQPLAATFVDTYLPMPMVHFALYLIPVVEFIIGTFLLLGLLTHRALLGSLLLFMVPDVRTYSATELGRRASDHALRSVLLDPVGLSQV